MGSTKEPGVEFVDTGTAPEFFVDTIGKHELIGANVRTYMCARRGNLLIVQYTNVIPITSLAIMARSALNFAARSHTEITLADVNGGQRAN